MAGCRAFHLLLQTASDSDGWLQEQDLKREEVYEVRKIIGKRIRDDDVVEYHVEWVHYGDWTTWEPEGNLEGAHDAIDAYNRGRRR